MINIPYVRVFQHRGNDDPILDPSISFDASADEHELASKLGRAFYTAGGGYNKIYEYNDGILQDSLYAR